MGLITRYRERLPFAPGDPVVSLEEGSTPLVLAERVSERAGVEVWLKLEGANPTGPRRRPAAAGCVLGRGKGAGRARFLRPCRQQRRIHQEIGRASGRNHAPWV